MSALSRRLKELRLAGMLLTRVPMGTLQDPVPDLPQARWAYPLVGLGLGVALALLANLAIGIGFSPVIVALLTVSGGAFLTGALHEDGLADLADGFWGGHAPTRRLEIMRDSRIGSYGVLAIVLVLALKVQAMALTFQTGAVWWPLIALAALSRFFMLSVQEFLPPARRDGMGFTASETGGWRFWAAAGIALVTLPFLGAAGLFVVLTMIAIAFGIAVLAKRKVGGQTGDVLGAVQLCCETGGWLVLSLAL